MKKLQFKRFAGDTVIIPMLIGVLLNSFCPALLNIGSFWTSMIHGTSALVGVFLFFMGTSINIRSTGKGLAKGAVIMGTKIALSILIGYAVAFFLNDSFLGLSSVALIGGLSVGNCAIYSGITAAMGDDSDKGAVAVTYLSVGPTVLLLAMSSAGLASISIGSLIGSFLPLLLGIVIGAVSPGLKQIFSAGVTPLMIMVAFALGANMSVSQLIQGGLSGILLGLIATFVVGILTVLVERLFFKEGLAAAAISSVAASGVANPQALAEVDPSYAAVAPIATAQIAAAAIVTSFLTPIFAGYIAKMDGKNR